MKGIDIYQYGNHAIELNPPLEIEDLMTGLSGIAYGIVNLGRLPQMSDSAGEPQMYYITKFPNGESAIHEKRVKIKR